MKWSERLRQVTARDEDARKELARKDQLNQEAAASARRNRELRAAELAVPLVDYAREFLTEYNEPRSKKIKFSGDYVWYGEGDVQVVKVFDGGAINDASDHWGWLHHSFFAITNAPGEFLYNRNVALKNTTWFPFSHSYEKPKGWSLWRSRPVTSYRFMRYEYEAGELDNEYGTATFNFARCVVNFSVSDRYEAMELLHKNVKGGLGYREHLH